MPKLNRVIDPEQLAAYESAMERIRQATGARTQVQLADVLEVRQSSISDAKRRASIPDNWLVKLLRSHKLHPDWIEFGTGPQFVDGDSHAAVAELQEHLRLVTEDFVRLVCRVEESLDVINMTDAELARRKAYHAGSLVVDLEKAQGLRNQLENMAGTVSAINN